MFTGIITEIGCIKKISSDKAGKKITIEAPRSVPGLRPGGSIAVDGVCLTVLSRRKGAFTVQVVPETLRRSILHSLESGNRVNLERPLRAAEELSGHFVQGHVDARARVVTLERPGKEVLLQIKLPVSLRGLIVEKGSIAINGVSLTVASMVRGGFSVALIPYTLKKTNLGDLVPGDDVNLETDILGKYVRALVAPHRSRRALIPGGQSRSRASVKKELYS